MQSKDDGTSTSAAPDREWPAQNPALDAALVAAIRAPVADAEFDRQVWARIRADAAVDPSASSSRRRQWFDAPLWLNALNVVAIGIVAVLVALALSGAAQRAAQSASAAMAALEQSQNATRIAVLIVSAAGLWLGLRRTPWARTIGL